MGEKLTACRFLTFARSLFYSRSADEKPRYQSGAYAMMGGYIAKLVAHAILWAIMYFSNKSRDANFGPADTKLAAAAGMEDKTESVKNNPYVFASTLSRFQVSVRASSKLVLTSSIPSSCATATSVTFSEKDASGPHFPRVFVVCLSLCAVVLRDLSLSVSRDVKENDLPSIFPVGLASLSLLVEPSKRRVVPELMCRKVNQEKTMSLCYSLLRFLHQADDDHANCRLEKGGRKTVSPINEEIEEALKYTDR